MISRFWLFSAIILAGCGGATLANDDSLGVDGGTTADGGTTPTQCLDACIAGELSWGPNGGDTTLQASSHVSACSAYVHQETSESGDLSCTGALSTSCAENGIRSGDLAGAVANADVKSAFAGTTTVFGSDPRGCDGSVTEVTYGGKTIEVGGDSCASRSACGPASTPCVPVPSGLRSLVTLLANLDAQELATPSCQSVFPGR